MRESPFGMQVRAVVDSNVVISALHRGGKPEAVLRLGRAGRVVLIASPFILGEIVGILRGRKFRWNDPRIADTIAALPIQVIEAVGPRLEALAHTADNRILECTVAANAHYLITGDHHLLELGSYCHTKILTPSEFLDVL